MVTAGRLVLIAVFAVAGVAKAVDRTGTRMAVTGFGVPAAAVPFVSAALPTVELTIAAGLLFGGLVVWAALAAAVLLVVFAAAMLRVLRAGEAPECRCFGAVGAAPVGPAAIARNVVLLAIAGGVGIGAHAGHARALTRVPGHASPWAIAAGAILVLHGAFSWQLFRQNGRLLARVEALETARAEATSADGPRRGRALERGAVAPLFTLPDLDGHPVSLAAVLAAGRGCVLVFTDPDCGACAPLLPTARASLDGPRVLFISRGSIQANRAKMRPAAGIDVLRQAGDEVGDMYGVFGFPAAVRVDPAGRIAGDLIQGAPDILNILSPGAPAVLELIQLGGSS